MANILEHCVAFLNNILWSYVLIAVLIGVGLYFTIRLRFAQFILFKDMFRETVTKDPSASPNAISSFQAFCVSAASRIGTGNIAGVAIAISLGGPGAVFWMWVIACVGAASSLVENTLAQIYKIKDGDNYRGGPAYYMQRGLNAKWMGSIFAVLTLFCYGFAFNAVQANTIADALHTYGANPLIVGIAIAALTAIIIFGGVQRIAHVAQYMVPIMAIIYLGIALFIMAKNLDALPAMFALIFKSAFGLEQAVGGGLGAAVMQGIKRGLFSNEAGMGSVPNIAAVAEVKHPVQQGLVQTLGVFVDTFLICTATAFMVLITNAYNTPGAEGVQIAQIALTSAVGSWGSYFLTLSIFLFAFSSIIGNYYYGETNLEFLDTHPSVLFFYRVLAVLIVILGSIAKLTVVWNIADLFMAAMVLLNLTAVTLLSKVAFAAFNDYIAQKKARKIPVFRANSIKTLKNYECWE